MVLQPPSLVNRVVSIEGERDVYSYWYVLTYLPDLQWCHVAPLERRGEFSIRSGSSANRPRWMLVAEEKAAMIDVGAARCRAVRAKEMVGAKENADEEEVRISLDSAHARAVCVAYL